MAIQEDRDFETFFFEQLVSAKADFVEALKPLADAYTKRGEFEKGLRMDRRLAELCPDDEMVFYNLACSYTLVGDNTRALQALGQAFALGYRDWDYLLKDPDLARLRADARFKKLAREYGR